MPPGICYRSFKIWTFPFQSCVQGDKPHDPHTFMRQWDYPDHSRETGLAAYIVAFPDCAMGMTDRATFILIIIWAFHSEATATIIYYKDPQQPAQAYLLKNAHMHRCVFPLSLSSALLLTGVQ